MNKGILNRYSLGILYLIGSLVGCSEEQLTDDPTLPIGKPVEVHLQVNAPLGNTADGNESAINRLRMVVFGSMGSPEAGRLILNKYYPTVPAGNSLKETITSGNRDIYLIANEPLGGASEDEYKKIATVADVRKLSLAYQRTISEGIYIPTEIPMFGKYLNQQFGVDTPNKIDCTVERTMAKVTLNLNVNNSHFPTDKQMVIDHIIIKELPKSSFLIPQKYTGELVDSEKQAVVGVVTAASGYDFSSTNTFYVPEYLFDKPVYFRYKGAYIEITGHINGEPSRVAKYSVKLGDAMGGEDYGDKYHITRNRHYTFTGNVKSYGEMDGVEVEVKVNSWEKSEMGDVEAPNNYFNIDRRRLGFQSFETSLQSSIATDVADWKLVKDGTTIFSFAEKTTASITIDKITYSLSGDVSNATITVVKPEGLKVFPIHQMNFIAKNLKVPFTVAYDNGFIPNSVLIDANWPADKLPPNGLQIAKRGDMVLPSGVAGSDDSFIEWKTSQAYTGDTAPELGMGVSSTAAMVGSEHIAAQYCRDMGEGWFLPSKNELELIYNNKSALGDSYSFSPPYWSSTEHINGQIWIISFSNGAPYTTYKDRHCSVRCVRFI